MSFIFLTAHSQAIHSNTKITIPRYQYQDTLPIPSNTLQYQDYNTKTPIPRYTTNTLPIPIHYHYQYTTTTNTLQYQDTLQYQYTPIPSNTKQYTSNTLTSNSKHDEAVALYIRGAFIRFESSHWLSLLRTELFVF